MLYSHIAIEGNIGSGKTTLATMLANDMDARLVLEQFADNPFLPKFYSDPEKHAFPLELFFMAERYHQLKNLKEQDLFKPQIVSDYFFVKSKLFAQNNLKKDEMQLFNRLFDIMLSSLSKPDLLVYLYSDVERLQQNIKNRGRDFEQNISQTGVQQTYFNLVKAGIIGTLTEGQFDYELENDKADIKYVQIYIARFSYRETYIGLAIKWRN